MQLVAASLCSMVKDNGIHKYLTLVKEVQVGARGVRCQCAQVPQGCRLWGGVGRAGGEGARRRREACMGVWDPALDALLLRATTRCARVRGVAAT